MTPATERLRAKQPFIPPPDRADWLRPLLFVGAMLVVVAIALLLLFLIDDAPSEQLSPEELSALLAEPPEPSELPPLWATPSRPSSLQINTNPDRASVWLNNEWIGVSPVRIEEQPPGYYTLSLGAEGHIPKDTSFYLASGSFFQFDVRLDPVNPRSMMPEPTARAAPPEATADDEPRRQIRKEGRSAGGGTSPVEETEEPQFEIASPEAVQQATHTGSLSITSNPPGAIVFVDGVPFGRAPLSLSDLRPDAYVVTLTIPGLEPLSYRAEVTAQSVAVVKATFPRPSDN
jgi:hypothetical protein